MIARLYSNENFPLPVVEALREHGHDVMTTHDAGKANVGIPDEERRCCVSPSKTGGL